MFEIRTDVLLPIGRPTVLEGSADPEIALTPSGDKWPHELNVRVGANSFSFPEFTDGSLGDVRGKWCSTPTIQLVRSATTDRNVFLVGCGSVLCIQPGSESCVKIYEMDRMEDSGFWRLTLRSLGDAFLVIHELGIARVEASGELTWKSELVLNDVFDGIDADYAYFNGDYGEDGDVAKQVSLTSGEIRVKRRSVPAPEVLRAQAQNHAKGRQCAHCGHITTISRESCPKCGATIPVSHLAASNRPTLRLKLSIPTWLVITTGIAVMLSLVRLLAWLARRN